MTSPLMNTHFLDGVDGRNLILGELDLYGKNAKSDARPNAKLNVTDTTLSKIKCFNSKRFNRY